MKIKITLFLILGLYVTNSFCSETYYVSNTGADQPENGTSEAPWLTLGYAISQVPADQQDTIRVAAGVYVFDTTLVVPTGVHIIGEGIDQTIFKAATSLEHPESGYNFDYVLIRMETGNNENIQILSDFTIDGNNKKLWGGIYVHNRNQVELKNLKLQGTYYTGIWLWGVNNSLLHDIYLENCSWGSTGYQTGCINLGNVENTDMYNITIREGLEGSPSVYGYGMKAIGPSATENHLTNVRLFNSDIDVNNTGIWNGGQAPNMSIEWHKVKLMSCEIFNNILADNLSLVNDEPTRYNQEGEISIRVHHNQFLITGGYAIELSEKYCEIDHNYFDGQHYPIANWDKNMESSGGWKIHHNTFVDNLQQLIRAEHGMSGIHFYNNSIYNYDTNLDQLILMVRNACSDITLDNNAVYYVGLRIPTLVDVSNNATTSNVSASNNCLFGAVRGTHVDNYNNNLEETDPGFMLSGDIPSPFLTLKSNSPCIDAGNILDFNVPDGKPDIGAYEVGGIPSTAPEINFIEPDDGAIFSKGTITLKVEAISGSGEIDRIEFFNELKESEITEPPFQYTTPFLTIGNYNYRARAIDKYGNVSSFKSVSFSVLGEHGNIIVNNEFDDGLSGWILSDFTGPNYTTGSNSVVIVQDGGLSGGNAAKVDVTSLDDQNWTINFTQKPLLFNLIKGHTYEISFMAKAETERSLTAAIRGNATNTDYFSKTVTLTTAPQVFGVYTYTCDDDNVANEGTFSFSFYLAKGILSDVYIDNIIVRDLANSSVNIQQLYAEGQILLYPNPAKDFLTIDFNSVTEKSQVQIYSLEGKLVQGIICNKHDKNLTIDTKKLNSGIYLLKIIGEREVITTKFIINRN